LWGRTHEKWLRRFLTLRNGILCHDTFRRLFERLDATAFQACLRQWLFALRGVLKVSQIAIDGKTLRGSGSSSLGPLQLVSAWATQYHLSLGQVAVDAKSNEITAIPQLLEMLDLHGALVTIDAMGCQKAIARQIVARGGDYVLTVKDNQEHLREDLEACVTDILPGVQSAIQVTSRRERGYPACSNRASQRSCVAAISGPRFPPSPPSPAP
jgi:hypothetical protein